MQRDNQRDNKGNMQKYAGESNQPTAFGAVASLAGVRVPAPSEARVSGNTLLWRLTGTWEYRSNAAECLSAFAALADEPNDQKFASFARRFGVLGILPNGMPGCAKSGEFPPHVGEGRDAWFVEPLAAWRGYARNAKACLVLAAAFQRGERIDPYRELLNAGLPRSELLRQPRKLPVPKDDFEIWGRFGDMGLAELVDNLTRVGSAISDDYLDFNTDPATRQRQWFGHHIAHTWLAMGAIRPDIDWTARVPRVVLAMSSQYIPPLSPWPEYSLVSVLAAQLAAALCTPKGLTLCPCGVPFVRRRSQRCPACRREATRLRSRKNMARYRAGERSRTTPLTTPKPTDDHTTPETM